MAETIGARERGRITPDEGAVLAAETARNADFGKPVLIYPNLYLVRVPLPHNPLRALNSYFILDDDGTTTIVDVGFNHPDCEQALDDALAALGRSWDKVQVVLTHSHPDHTGNLDRIWREGMPVLANLHSFQEVKNLMEIEDNVYGPLLLQAATLEQQRDLTFDEKGPRLHVSAELLPLSTYPVMTYLADGDCLKVGEFEFEVIETPGHDPWHICLYEAAHKVLPLGRSCAGAHHTVGFLVVSGLQRPGGVSGEPREGGRLRCWTWCSRPTASRSPACASGSTSSSSTTTSA